MIKWIKSLWKKLFSKKEKKEEIISIKIDHCGTHSRYKKSCPACKAMV